MHIETRTQTLQRTLKDAQWTSKNKQRTLKHARETGNKVVAWQRTLTHAANIVQ